MDTNPTNPASTSPSAPAPGLLHDLGFEPFQIWAALLSALVWLLLCGGAVLLSPSAYAQTSPVGESGVLQAYVQTLLHDQALLQSDNSKSSAPWRVEVVLGQLDPRLKLAPCDKIKAYVPAGMRLWGNTRVGLRCEQGAVRWNVYWPVAVKVWGQALVVVGPLRPGAPLAMEDLRMAEVDLASHASPAVLRAEDVVGRTVVRQLSAGQSLRQEDVKVRRWFAAGDPVRLTVKGRGFSVASEGTALTAGDEGQCAKIRLDGGRVVCGEPVGARQVEILL
ncbi:flagellar basal body P-ring formation chaperone FlgA [Aquabacterium sp.]|uniref:flagellar basal body P-ring formation chaperone FlgA n=1 Tax=Aquabacterium sp. TaxID=1872578 RepID=UPI00199475C9|nr:flagellar basal body P-ring formation chaperone FlgA [Aquabacterium sp.]MBC7701942.1 flagellar basal body P-ring formation protein FlgA [Aquabacterium sp.]